MKITKVIGREVYDSRGMPTIQCEIGLENGICVTAAAPSGIARARYEAHELRDGGRRLWGKGVLKGLEALRDHVAPMLIGKPINAIEMDMKLLEIDGTADKSYIGANVLVATSMALYKAHAAAEEIELYELIAYICGAESVSLPFPVINLIQGGRHAENNLQIQDFMIVPVGSSNFRSSLELSVTAFHELKSILQKYGRPITVGDEGGLIAGCKNDKEALDALMETLERIDYAHTDARCAIALHIGASQLYNPTTKKYVWNNKNLSTEELIEHYEQLIDSYPIYSLEDPLSEDDWEGWQALMQALQQRVQIVGDDLFASNMQRLVQGIEHHVASGVTVKPSQIGTITEALQFVQVCKQYNLNPIISHQAGEMEDSFLADLSVGTSAGQIKAGGCCRGERIAKYNRLLAIEDSLALAALELEFD
jgi:enolase